MNLKPFISSLLILSLSFQIGCIHTSPEETISVEPLPLNRLIEQKEPAKGLKLEYFVYSKSNDAVLSELLDLGMVPVFVRLTNESSKTLSIQEKYFALTDKHLHQVTAIPEKDVPKALRRFNVGAVGANIYNTGVVVVGSVLAVVFIAALVYGASQVPGCYSCTHLNSSSDSHSGNSSSTSASQPIYNETNQRINLNYKGLLLKARDLGPGEKAEGLVFFETAKDFRLDQAKASFRQ